MGGYESNQLPKSNEITKNSISGNDIQGHQDDDKKHENELDLELYTGETIKLKKKLKIFYFKKVEILLVKL